MGSLRQANLKNILVTDTISYLNDEDEYESAIVLKDNYVGANAIHILDLHVIWKAKEGDVEKLNITCQKRAEWLYENASVIERGITGRKRIKETVKKKQRKYKKYKNSW